MATKLVPIARTPATAVWLLLIIATLTSWRLGTHHGSGPDDDHTAASVAILVVSFAKARFVGLYFMELRDSLLALRLAFEGYCIMMFAVVVGLYLAT